MNSCPTKHLVILALLLSSASASGESVFTDSFNNSPDWQSGETGGIDIGGGTNCAWPRTWTGSGSFNPDCAPPPNWHSYRVSIPKRGGHAKTYVLSAEGARKSGKGITYNSEPNDYGSWTGGGLDVYLGNTGHQELYVRFWMRYDPVTWAWGNVVPDFGLGKMIRISRFKDIPSDTSNPQVFGTSGKQMPVLFPDWMNNPAYTPQIKFNYSHRYDPDYNVTDGTSGVDIQAITWPSDGEWHSYEWRVKMNSSPGTADGEWEFWIDGSASPNKHYKKTGVPWIQAAGSTTPGWNWFTVLDNVTNQTHAPPFATHEITKIHMDDFVASTHYSGPPAAPVNVSAALTTGTNVRVNWSAGTNGATFLLAGYRIYYGTDSNNLNNTIDTGNVNSHEISNLTSGQTYYFAVRAFNQASYDLNENESLSSNIVSAVVSGAGDSTAPSISAFSLPETSTSLVVPITALAASDDVAVSGFILSEVAASPSAAATGWQAAAPASFIFPAAGARTVYAWAKDTAGNVSSSASATVLITLADISAPAVSITTPANGASIKGSVALSAAASDDVGVTKVEFNLDGALIGSDTSSPYTLSWNTVSALSGTHALTAIAYDAAGNTKVSEPVSVTLRRIPKAPIITNLK